MPGTTSMPGAVLIGDALIDELRWDDRIVEAVGGAALNVAVGLAVLGVPARLLSPIGEDPDGERIRAYLAEFGVELLASPSERGTMRAVSSRSGGEPSYTFNPASLVKRVTWDDAAYAATRDAAIVGVSCYALDDDEQAAQLRSAVDPARLVLDPNPRPAMVGDMGRFAVNFRRASEGALLVKVGEDDAELLGGGLDRLAGELLESGVRMVLGTLGSGGAFLRTPDGEVRLPVASLPGAVIDTMGAGDSMLASAIAWLVGTGGQVPADPEPLLARALEIAAATVRGEGALLRRPRL